jgi:hypothetical protein
MVTIIRYHQTDTPVEQQTPGGTMQPDYSLWVINPNKAAIWSSDDNYMITASGNLQPGEMFSYDVLEYADWAQSHLITYTAGAKKANIRMKFEVPEVGFSLERPSGQMKILGPVYARESSYLAPILGSNGGIAKLVTLRFSVQNLGSRVARDVDMTIYVHLNLEPFQPNNNEPNEPRFWWN